MKLRNMHFLLRRDFFLISAFVTAIFLPMGAMAQTPQALPDITSGSSSSTMTWNGVAGRVYFIQTSTDLANWTYAPLVRLGTGATLSFGLSTTGGRCFVHLKYTSNTNFTAGEEGDVDGDGLNNEAEVTTHHTDHTIADTDNDGIPDGWEILYGLNPLSNADAVSDSDGDGLSNLQEYTAGSVPTKFNMPEFTLLSASRQAVIVETVHRPVGGAFSLNGSATGSGEGTTQGTYPSSTFTWSATSKPLNAAAVAAWSLIPAPTLSRSTHSIPPCMPAVRKCCMGTVNSSGQTMFRNSVTSRAKLRC